MLRFNGAEISLSEAVEVFFSDRRILRMLKSMHQVNSALGIASFVLLIPILTSLLDPSRDYSLLLCISLFPAICICQSSSFVARRAKKRKSVRLLKASVGLSVSYCLFASLGLVAVIALLVLSIRGCTRPTCVSDAICSGILCIITALGIVYNIIHSRLLIKAIWFNELLSERTVSLDLESLSDENAIQTISEVTEGRESQVSNERQGFFYLRMSEPSEVFP